MILKLIMNVWTYHLGKGVLGMKETNKVFKILVASICCCYLFSVSMYPVKVFADETAFNSNTKSHRKSEILKTYPPNLSEMQEGSGKAEKQTCNYRYGVYRSKGFGNPWSDWGNSRIIFSDYVTGSGRCAD